VAMTGVAVTGVAMTGDMATTGGAAGDRSGVGVTTGVAPDEKVVVPGEKTGETTGVAKGAAIGEVVAVGIIVGSSEG